MTSLGLQERSVVKETRHRQQGLAYPRSPLKSYR